MFQREHCPECGHRNWIGPRVIPQRNYLMLVSTVIIYMIYTSYRVPTKIEIGVFAFIVFLLAALSIRDRLKSRGKNASIDCRKCGHHLQTLI